MKHCCAMVVVVASVVLATTAGEAMAYKMPAYYGGLQNYYYIAAGPTEPPKHNVPTNNPAKGNAAPQAYQKYIACVARTFVFEECTLCFCTDIPNVGLCWDYEAGEKCARTQQLVDSQRGAENNDPYGIW